MISHDYLTSILDYDSNTGILTWKIKKKRSKVNIGDTAGNINNDGYLRITIDGKHYSGHRLIWFYVTKSWPDRQIDHINNIRNDNRWENLRLATSSQNQFNVNKTSRNTSGYIGVYKTKNREHWSARIMIGNKNVYLGYFQNIHDAARAYNKAALETRGEYAKLNVIVDE